MESLLERFAFFDLQNLQWAIVLVGLIGFAIAETVIPDRREALAARALGGARNVTMYAFGVVLLDPACYCHRCAAGYCKHRT